MDPGAVGTVFSADDAAVEHGDQCACSSRRGHWSATASPAARLCRVMATSSAGAAETADVSVISEPVPLQTAHDKGTHICLAERHRALLLHPYAI